MFDLRFDIAIHCFGCRVEKIKKERKERKRVTSNEFFINFISTELMGDVLAKWLLTERWGVVFGEDLILGPVRVEVEQMVQVTDAVCQ